MVLQRWQSLFMFLAVVLLVVFTFLPFCAVRLYGEPYSLGVWSTGLKTMLQPNWVLLPLTGLTALLTLITIFKYRNLKKQQCWLNVCLFLNFALIVAVALFVFFTKRTTGELSISSYIVLPVISFIALLLARMGVKHDKKLLSDSERIR